MTGPEPSRSDLAFSLAYYALAVLFGVLTVSDLVFSEYTNAFGHFALALAWLAFSALRRSWLRFGYRKGRFDAVQSARTARATGVNLGTWIVDETVRAAEDVSQLSRRGLRF